MRRSAWLPLISGGTTGLLAGGIGAFQVIACTRAFAQQNAEFDKSFPPGYTGYRDATNLVRGGEWTFAGTGALAIGVIAVLMIVAATISVVLVHKSCAAISTTLIAGAISTIIYVSASAIAFSTGFHPMAPYQDSVSQALPGCIGVCMTIMFVLAWITGLIGAGLGLLFKPMFAAVDT